MGSDLGGSRFRQSRFGAWTVMGFGFGDRVGLGFGMSRRVGGSLHSMSRDAGWVPKTR